MNQGMITPTTCKTHTCTVTHIRFYIGTEIPLSSLPNKRSGFNPVQLTEKEALPIFHRPTVVSQYTALISNTDVTTFFLLLPVPRWHKPSCVITLKMLASLSLNSGGKKKNPRELTVSELKGPDKYVVFNGFLGFTITERSTVKEQKEKTKHMCGVYRSQEGDVGLKQRKNGT